MHKLGLNPQDGNYKPDKILVSQSPQAPVRKSVLQSHLERKEEEDVKVAARGQVPAGKGQSGPAQEERLQISDSICSSGTENPSAPVILAWTASKSRTKAHLKDSKEVTGNRRHWWPGGTSLGTTIPTAGTVLIPVPVMIR